MRPLDPAAVSARLGAIDAKNNARTPIGASLEKVVDDMKSVRGERLVVLLTDGEETCGGDPAAAVAALRKAGMAVRVNIVGFAIDDLKLATSFRLWADAGDGAYFDARDAESLGKAMSLALQPKFEVVDGANQVIATGVAGGDSVKVMPGNYTVRLRGGVGASKPVTIKSREAATVRF